MQPIVLYDAACPLCRQLAAWIERKGGGRIAVEPAEPEAADRLRVKTSEGLIEGVAAWEYLIKESEELSSLAWLAARLGLTRPSALVLSKAGTLGRRLCRRCPD